MSIAVLQQKANNTNTFGATSIAAAFTSNVSPASLVWVVVNCAMDATVTSVVDSNGLSYTYIGQASAGPSDQTTSHYWGIPTPGPLTITASLPSGSSTGDTPSIFIAEIGSAASLAGHSELHSNPGTSGTDNILSGTASITAPLPGIILGFNQNTNGNGAGTAGTSPIAFTSLGTMWDSASAGAEWAPLASSPSTVQATASGAFPQSNMLMAVFAGPPPPTITTQPTTQRVTVGSTATLSVSATAAVGPLSYQWQINTGSGFSNISGATSSSYTTGVLTDADSLTQYCVILTDTGSSTTVTSNAVRAIAEFKTSGTPVFRSISAWGSGPWGAGAWGGQSIQSLPGSSNVTGTGASTQASQVSGGVGGVASTGTGADTQSKGTTSAAGAVVISGTGASSQSPALTAGTASLNEAGTGSSTQAKNTDTGTGSTAITGLGADTEAAQTSAGSGASTITGSGSSTQAVTLTNGAGNINSATITGAGGSTNANSDAGAGAVLAAGSGAGSQQPQTTVSSGVVAVAGLGASIQAHSTQLGTGVVAVSGTGASQQASNVSAGVAVDPDAAVGNALQASNISSGTGSAAISGAGASTQSVNTTAGFGSQGNAVSGAGASVQTSALSSGSGGVGISGTGVEVQSPASDAGSATLGISGSGAAVSTVSTCSGTLQLGIIALGAQVQASAISSGLVVIFVGGSGASTQARNVSNGHGDSFDPTIILQPGTRRVTAAALNRTVLGADMPRTLEAPKAVKTVSGKGRSVIQAAPLGRRIIQ